jgi:hypothetical protein
VSGLLHCRAGASTTTLAFLHAASQGWKDAVVFLLEDMKVNNETITDTKVRPSFRHSPPRSCGSQVDKS